MGTNDGDSVTATAHVTHSATATENGVSAAPDEYVDWSLEESHLTLSTTRPTSSSSSAFFLESAAASLVVRAEVAECLFDLLRDVETTHYLNSEVAHVARVRQLERKLQEKQHALDEMSCLYHNYSRARVDLADEVVRDFSRLTEDMLALERQSKQSQQEAQAAAERVAVAEQTAAKAAAAEAEALEAAAAAHAAMLAAAVEAAAEKEQREQARVIKAAASEGTKVDQGEPQNETVAQVENNQNTSETKSEGDLPVNVSEDLVQRHSEEDLPTFSDTQNEPTSNTEVSDNETTSAAPPLSAEEPQVTAEPDTQPRDDASALTAAAAEAASVATVPTQADGEADVAAGATAPEDENTEIHGARSLPGAEPADAAAGTITAVEPAALPPQQQEQRHGGPEEVDDGEEGRAAIPRAQSSEQPSQASSGAPTSNNFFFDSNVPYNLETMDEPTLMNIFSYLEAFEILNTAQVNIIMYSRVDSLFRLSGGGDEGGTDGAEAAAVEIDAADENPDNGDDAVVAVDDDEVDETVSEVAATTTVAATVDKKTSGQKPTPVQVVSMTATTVKIPPVPVSAVIKSPVPATAVAPAPSPAPAPAPSLASGAFGGIGSGGLLRSAGLIGGGMRNKPAAPSSNSQTSADAATPGAKVQSGLTNMFAMLQNRGKTGNEAGASSSGNTTGTTSATANAKTTGETTESTSGGSGAAAAAAKGSTGAPSDSGPEWTPKLADAMSSKLSPAELSVIIAMREGLRQKESELVRLRAQKEDLAAQLQSTEGVKEFLIGKVRDTEGAFKALQKDTMESSKQAASDQEVIAHLDDRVQELEATVREMKDRNEASRQDLKQVRDVSVKKVRVLSDMLQFEREQLAESEKAWKTTKKLLVKEVKHCRAQILALQAERDSYYQQNLKMREAVLNSSNNSTNMLNGGGGGK